MSLIRHHSLGDQAKLITFWGLATNPADNTSLGGSSPIAVVPPANMVAGDLVYCSMFCAGGGFTTFSVSNSGGQSWTQVVDRNSALPAICTFWCTFNGAWSANPSFDTDVAGVARSVQMFVFRPAKAGAVWAVDQPVTMASSTGGSSVVAGVTNTKNKVVTVVRNILSTSAQTYSSHSPGSFHQMGSNFRNTGSNNKNALYFYKVQAIGEATGDLTVNITGSATHYKSMQSFYYT